MDGRARHSARVLTAQGRSNWGGCRSVPGAHGVPRSTSRLWRRYRDERADEMKGGGVEHLKGLGGVVPFIKDQGDVLTALGHLAVALAQFLADGLEGGRVVDVAGVNFVEEGAMEVGADEHPQVDLAQVAAFLLVVAAGGQGGRIAGVDIGEEIGAVIDERAQVELQIAHQAFGELVGGGGQQAGKDALAMPSGQLGLAAGSDGTVERGQQEILPDRQALVPLGELGVDEFRQAELDRLVIEDGDCAEGQDFGPLRCWRGLGLLDGLEEAFEGAQVGGL